MIAILYSAATGRVRSWIVGENIQPRPAVGEAMLEISAKDYGDLNKLQALVTQASGKIPADDRFVVVDAHNKIVGAVIADLACGDRIPDCTLVAHSQADEKWTVSNDGQGGKSLTAPLPVPPGPPAPEQQPGFVSADTKPA